MTISSNPAAPPRRSLALITDDEAAIGAIVGRIVTEFDLVPVLATDYMAALDTVQAHRAELACAIVGRLKPSLNVATTACAIQAVAPDLPLIMMGSVPPAPTSPCRPALRLFGFLFKPFIIADLRGLLRRLVQRSP
jgi:DNA-binding NtrC family response regulator